jgi:hypothetical protein
MANPHPTINFQVNLEIPKTEAMGPVTNSHTSTLLHPDLHDSDPDRGRTNRANRTTYKTVSPWLQTGSGSQLMGILGDKTLKHGDTFTLYGKQALYVRDNYAVGYAPADRAWLDVV